MNHGGFSGIARDRQQFFLDEAAWADIARHAVIHMAAGINRAFYRADEALRARPVDRFPLSQASIVNNSFPANGFPL